MKRIFLVTIILWTLSAFAAAQSVEKCFESGWLQQSHLISFKIDGAKISGTFTVTREGENTSYDFTGAKNGGILNVKFTGGKAPDISPSEMRGLVWTLAPKGTGEVLKIKVYGKNYQTDKYEISYAEYKSCSRTYESLFGKAEQVSFAKGAKATKMNIAFASNDEEKVFLINARKAQSLLTVAYGCSITIYLPNRKLYYEEENPGEKDSGKTSTVLDVSSILSLPLTGNYMVVLKNAGGGPTRSREIEFKVMN